MTAKYPSEFLIRSINLQAAVRPQDLLLNRTHLIGTFGEHEREVAVMAVLTPSRDAGRWVAPSWLMIAAQEDWDDSDRLPGRFGYLPVAAELDLERTYPPPFLGPLVYGLRSLISQDFIVLERHQVAAFQSVEFLVPQASLVEKLIERQARQAARSR